VTDAVTQFLKLCVCSQLVSQATCDAVLHFVEVGLRGLVVPVFMMCSWPLQAYGIWYVAYALPLAKCAVAKAGTVHDSNKTKAVPPTERTAIQWLQFWVLHTVLTAACTTLAGVLWWIPFSNVAMFGAYAALAVTVSIESLYETWILQELQSFHILPLGDHQTVLPLTHEAKLVRLFYWVIDKLPKAVNDDDDKNENAAASTVSSAKEEVDENDAGLVHKRDTVSVDEKENKGTPRRNSNEGSHCSGSSEESAKPRQRKAQHDVDSPSDKEESFAKETIVTRTRRRTRKAGH
jgi:hypothetical protein